MRRDVSDEFKKLHANADAMGAAATSRAFSYSHRKEYLEWLTEAKRPETRSKRLATPLVWLTAGKSRH